MSDDYEHRNISRCARELSDKAEERDEGFFVSKELMTSLRDAIDQWVRCKSTVIKDIL